MKKFAVFIFVLLFIFPSIPVSANTTDTESGLVYSIENDEVTIEGWEYEGAVLNIPETIEGYPVKHISDQAFRGNNSFAELRLPSSIITIGEYAFAECHNLVKVVIEGAETIGYSAFRECRALLSISLPSNLILIDDSAFENCTMLGKVKIPASLTKIGVDAFIGCDRIRFDASENSYAKQYAKQYAIPTSFFDTWEFTVILIVVISVTTVTAYFLLTKHLKKRKSLKQKEL